MGGQLSKKRNSKRARELMWERAKRTRSAKQGNAPKIKKTTSAPRVEIQKQTQEKGHADAEGKSDRKPQPNGLRIAKEVFRLVREHPVGSAVVAFFLLSLSPMFNYFGPKPRMLYVTAIGLCILLDWVILACAHAYISAEESKDTSQ